MKKIYLIGIGPGSPDYLTVQAINTMKKVDVFFLLEKQGERKEEFIRIRRDILEKYVESMTYRVVNAVIPGIRKSRDYEAGIKAWRQEKAEVISRLIEEEMSDGESGGILVWGDPALYDGHMEILQDILEQGRVDFEYEVIPGITSIQILTAKHKIPLNRIGETVVITTGRRLAEYSSQEIRNTVVLLDSYSTASGATAFRHFEDTDLDIYWGGYLGGKDETLVSGKLKDVVEEIKKVRGAARKKKGWIMDTYILRRTE